MRNGRLAAWGGVAGPLLFTAAWAVSSLRQSGHPAAGVQLSGLAAEDARDPQIMVVGFVVLGGCSVGFGAALRRVAGHRSLGPWLVMTAGAAAVAAGAFRRDHMLLAGPGFAGESWHNQVHDVVSGVAYAAMLTAPLVLARRFRADPQWAVIARPVQVLALASAAAMAVFASRAAEPWNGVVQRAAVTLALAAEALAAARMLTLPEAGNRTARDSGGQGRLSGQPGDGAWPVPGLADAGDRAAVFQVDASAVPCCGPHAAPDRGPEQGERGVQRGEPVLGDLLWLYRDRGQGRVAGWPAVEQEPDAAGVPGTAGAEVDACQPAAAQLDAAFLAHLPPARIPRRLPVRLHDTAGYRPARFVRRLEDQQPPRPVEDQRPGRRRDRRKLGSAHAVVIPTVSAACTGLHVPTPHLRQRVAQVLTTMSPGV